MSRLVDGRQAFANVLRSRNLRLAQLSSAATWTAEFAFVTALGVYAFNEGGATAVGVVGFARVLPAAFALPFAGALADRMPRERLLLAAGLLRAGAVGLAAAAAAVDAPAITVYALAVVGTIAFTVYRPAHSALVPSLCHTPGELTSANVVRSLLDALSALVGPLAAGLLLALGSVSAAFAATALLALYSAVAIARIRYEPPPLPPREERRVIAEAVEGMRALGRERHAALLIGLAGAQAFVRGALNVFVVVVALELLGTGDAGVAVLWAAFGAGGLIGALSGSLLLGSPRMAAFFGLGISMWGVPIAAVAAAPEQVPVLLLLAVVGAGNALVDVTIFTLLQRLLPDRLLARGLGNAEMGWTITMAAGSLATPGLISLLGVEGALVAVGLLLPALVVITWAGLRRIDGEVEVRNEDIALLRRVPLLRPLPVPAIEHLALRSEPVQVPAGQVLFNEGDPGDRFYVIAAGEAEVLGGGRRIRTLGPGDCFGEIALLRSGPRTATVRASSDLELRALDAGSFVPAVGGYSGSMRAAQEVVSDRLAAYPGPAAEPMPVAAACPETED